MPGRFTAFVNTPMQQKASAPWYGRQNSRPRLGLLMSTRINGLPKMNQRRNRCSLEQSRRSNTRSCSQENKFHNF